MPDSMITQAVSGAPALATDCIPIGRLGLALPRKLKLSDFIAHRRNFLINGDCRIAQRGNLVVNANSRNYGGCDRIAITSAGFTTVQYIMLQAATLGVSGYSQQIGNLVTTGAGSLTYDQRIESLAARMLGFQTVTFSVKVLQNTGVDQNVQLVLRSANAVDNFSTMTLIVASSVNVVPTNTTTTLKLTTTLADVSNGLCCEVYFSAVGAFGGGGVQIYISDFQTEIGTDITSLDPRSIADELALAERYYEKTYNLATAPGAVTIPGVICAPAFLTSHVGGAAFKVRKRAAPTVVINSRNGTAAKVAAANTGADVGTSVTAQAIGEFGFQSAQDSGSGFTIGTLYEYHYTAAAEL